MNLYENATKIEVEESQSEVSNFATGFTLYLMCISPAIVLLIGVIIFNKVCL